MALDRTERTSPMVLGNQRAATWASSEQGEGPGAVTPLWSLRPPLCGPGKYLRVPPLGPWAQGSLQSQPSWVLNS